MIRRINSLSSSGSEQSLTGNYGVGAKIAAATKNPAGVVYQSWKAGHGCMVQLEKNSATGNYGLHQWELKDGTYSYYVPLDDAVKPAEIATHGTKVILMGANASDVTIAPPTDASSPSRWISKYLNTRYFQFPAGLTIKAREGWESPRSDKDRNLLRTITGQKVYLDQHAVVCGVASLSNANVHWWLLKDEPAVTNNSGFIKFFWPRGGAVPRRAVRARHRQDGHSIAAKVWIVVWPQVRRPVRRASPGDGPVPDDQHGANRSAAQRPTAPLG